MAVKALKSRRVVIKGGSRKIENMHGKDLVSIHPDFHQVFRSNVLGLTRRDDTERPLPSRRRASHLARAALEVSTPTSGMTRLNLSEEAPEYARIRRTCASFRV